MCVRDFQAGLVARLTWWELSWDIMEPVTYMLTFTTGIGGIDIFPSPFCQIV